MISVLADGSFNDPENARVILLCVGALLLLALLVAVGTIWWWRSSVVEHPALGPLEVMGSRSWWKGDYATRRRRLESARPLGAEVAGGVASPLAESVDLEAAASAVPPRFDDLFEVEPGGARPDPVAPAVVDPKSGELPSAVVDVAPVDEPKPSVVAAPMDPLLRSQSSE